jgi:hypothetical protein
MNESEKKSHSVVTCEGSKEIVVKEKPGDKLTKKFTFDKVFGPESKQVKLPFPFPYPRPIYHYGAF